MTRLKYATVKEVVSWNCDISHWNLTFVRSLNDWEEDGICNLLAVFAGKEVTEFLSFQGFSNYIAKVRAYGEIDYSILEKLEEALGKGQSPMSVFPEQLPDPDELRGIILDIKEKLKVGNKLEAVFVHESLNVIRLSLCICYIILPFSFWKYPLMEPLFIRLLNAAFHLRNKVEMKRHDHLNRNHQITFK
ncbi:hypothetical protein Cgig2_025262 [Carnegiea gigantea]|uniref:Uncharacterized protein n=1 Tax=Carnegiea gigantea TaxID=171969 RepID=A0A9Q1JPH1_9CARY|nr:hypothetical protein Cgig2_025262 [Carnegiea gigantea]